MIAKYGKFEYALAEHYRFEDELGRGAMGTVYRAKDVKLGRPVAIKMLHPMLTNELGIARFQSEIRIAAGLHHPNIIGLHDSGEADGRLYYVMDYLGGETLRDRLNREKQLSVDDAIGIVEQVAAGLQYAHDHNVVHRDIKPENILLAEGRACVVDFGLARALGDVDTDRLTASGLSVGTPHYLAPEQAAAERDVGPKADQYALACVLYEMLVGEPPFTGPTATSIAMRHITERPRSLRLRRHTTPESVDAAVMRAMEKVPADRFASAVEFVRALRSMRIKAAERVELHQTPRMNIGRVFVGALVVLGVVGLALRVGEVDDGVRWLTNRTLDTSRYVVFPLATRSGTTDSKDIDHRLRDAFVRWDGVVVPGSAELRSASGGRPASSLDASEGASIARSLDARHFVVGELAMVNGQQLIRADLLDTRRKEVPRSASVEITAGASVDSALSHLAFMLLFGGESTKSESAARGTKSKSALASYLRGRKAAAEWNLILADSEFVTALRMDPSFPQALLSLAQVRSWMHDDTPELEGMLSRAMNDGARMTQTERTHAAALRDLVMARFPLACVRYDSLVKRDSMDFGGWYGLAECNRRDRTVTANPASRTGMTFRGSPHTAASALARAFDLLPRLDACCATRAHVTLRRLLMTSTTSIKTGVGVPPDSRVFGAYPELDHDTVAFYPSPIEELQKAPPASNPLAIQRYRELYFDIAAKRLTQFPKDADALEELGEAMELLAYPAAVDTIRRARSLAVEPHQLLRLAVSEGWLRLKAAVPHDLKEVAAVRLLADSLLTHARPTSGSDAALLATMAALVGDANRAAQLSESLDPKDDEREVPPDVLNNSRALLAYAGLGGPVDSIREREQRLANSIRNGVPPSKQAKMSSRLLRRPAVLAFPFYRLVSFQSLDTSNALVATEGAFMRGDRQSVRKLLHTAAQARAGLRPSDLTLDAIYPEAWLFAAIGDTASAMRTIAPAIDAIRAMPIRRFADVATVGALVRAMSLRAEILYYQGDREHGRQWARVVSALTDTSLVLARVTRARALEMALSKERH